MPFRTLLAVIVVCLLEAGLFVPVLGQDLNGIILVALLHAGLLCWLVLIGRKDEVDRDGCNGANQERRRQDYDNGVHEAAQAAVCAGVGEDVGRPVGDDDVA